jgi:hypothetical protein
VDSFCESDPHLLQYSRFSEPSSGGINMPSLLPFLGHTELEGLSIVGSIILIGTHLTTVTSVKERILLASGCAWHYFLCSPMI